MTTDKEHADVLRDLMSGALDGRYSTVRGDEALTHAIELLDPSPPQIGSGCGHVPRPNFCGACMLTLSEQLETIPTTPAVAPHDEVAVYPNGGTCPIHPKTTLYLGDDGYRCWTCFALAHEQGRLAGTAIHELNALRAEHEKLRLLANDLSNAIDAAYIHPESQCSQVYATQRTMDEFLFPTQSVKP